MFCTGKLKQGYYRNKNKYLFHKILFNYDIFFAGKMANTHGTSLRKIEIRYTANVHQISYTPHFFQIFFSWLLLSDSMHIVSLFAAQAAFYITKKIKYSLKYYIFVLNPLFLPQ